MTPPAEIARLRQGLYRFFGGAFAPPEPAHLDRLTAAAEIMDSFDLTRYAFWREWSALTGSLRSETGIERLQAEHVRLFGSGTDGVLCPPVESYYRVEGRHEATPDIVAAIERDYRELGLATSAADAPDHVTTQLEIMAMLCAHESQAWESGGLGDARRLLDTEREFLRRHLRAWIPQFRDRGRAAGANDYYVALLDATHSFVVHDDYLIGGLRDWSGAVA